MTWVFTKEPSFDLKKTLVGRVAYIATTLSSLPFQTKVIITDVKTNTIHQPNCYVWNEVWKNYEVVVADLSRENYQGHGNYEKLINLELTNEIDFTLVKWPVLCRCGYTSKQFPYLFR